MNEPILKPNPKCMINKLDEYIKMIVFKPLQDEVFEILMVDYADELLTKPAAKNYHHNYKGGLLQHTLEVVEVALKLYELSDEFTFESKERDLTIASALLHDIGKIYSYEFDSEGNVQYMGEKDNHFLNGIKIIEEKIGFKLHREVIVDVIKSHHNLIEWGSLKRPETELEWIIHLADMYSAKLKGRIIQ